MYLGFICAPHKNKVLQILLEFKIVSKVSDLPVHSKISARQLFSKHHLILQQLRFSKDGIGRTNASNGSIEVAQEIQINAEYVFFLRGSALAENEACS